MTCYYSTSVEETEQIAAEFAKSVRAGAVIAFFGDLGSGKTTFIKSLASHISGIPEEEVISPTFQYLNIYQGRLSFYHFDLWRLQEASDFLKLGFEEMLQQGGICCIEWAERIEELLPKETIRISIAHTKNNSRSIGITW